MPSKYSNTLNEQKQSLSNGGCNVPDGAHSELSKSLKVPDGTRQNRSNRSASQSVPDGTLSD